jgi:iron complex outermembrane receptor protein
MHHSLRMDDINIGYNVGKVMHNKANLRLSANVQNAFVITKYKGLDPEMNGGIDNNFYQTKNNSNWFKC